MFVKHTHDTGENPSEEHDYFNFVCKIVGTLKIILKGVTDICYLFTIMNIVVVATSLPTTGCLSGSSAFYFDCASELNSFE